MEFKAFQSPGRCRVTRKTRGAGGKARVAFLVNDCVDHGFMILQSGWFEDEFFAA